MRGSDCSVFYLLVSVVCILTAQAESGHHKHVVYHGLIREDALGGDEVRLDKPLFVRDRNGLVGEEVCGYTVYKSSEVPFEVVLDEPRSVTGAAHIILTPGLKLNYESKARYTFEVAAHDCEQSHHSRREKVHVELEDVNEYPPTWVQPTYYAEAREGQLYDNITQVRATDEDGSEEYSAICNYNLLTPNVPFKISADGVVTNTEPLEYSHNHNFVLEVKAEDCGGAERRTSEKVMVSIRVLEKCKLGWKGFSDRIEFAPGSGQKPLAEDARFELCDDTCHESVMSTTVKLATEHIGKGCDRDTYSIQSQRKLCGASSGSIDLLPSTNLGLWSETIPSDDGHDSDQVFSFDGKTNAVEVPENRLDHALQKHFTIAMWMKHAENPEDPLEKGTKEHILCNADGEKMNRHHYALFIHNCKLVLLIRQEPEEGVDLNKFKPAEWRWKLAEVCDNQWHHYAVSMDMETNSLDVNLYVDGHLVVTNDDNLEIIDDWPLHPSQKVHFTKLVVGACWMGGENHLSQFFRGFLADLTILNGKTESARVIQCLNNCKEQLDFHAMDQMEAGMSIAFNTEMAELTINGKNRSEVEKLVRRIGYTNSRRFPTPGHRSLNVHTTLTCEDGRQLDVPDVDTMVMVLEMEKPIISIYGTENLARSEHALELGEKVFHNVNIYSRTQKEDEEMQEADTTKYADDYNDNHYKLDSCNIVVQPPMNINFESIRYPEHLLQQLNFEAYESENGLIIAGADIITNYEEVLRSIQYVNDRPEDMNSRLFKLTCSELNGRFVSNELVVRLDVIHVDHHQDQNSVQAAPRAQAASQHVNAPSQVKNVKELHLQDDTLFKSTAGTGGTGVGMVVIIVVCVGFLLFMIVLGVIRIRSAHQRIQETRDVEEKPEMEWDNSALTITVNPMDQENYGEEAELHGHQLDDDSSDDDDGSDFHDEIESSEEEAEKVKDRDLEWDDSTLTF